MGTEYTQLSNAALLAEERKLTKQAEELRRKAAYCRAIRLQRDSAMLDKEIAKAKAKAS